MIYWERRKYTKEQFMDAWNNSNSISSCAKKLGLTVYGSTYKVLRNTAEDLGLDESHMTGQAWSRGKVFGPRKDIEEYLILGSRITSHTLKHKLYRAGLKEEKCERCGLVDWLDKPISLHLEHKNGNNKDNRLENLEILCPNCHSQTDTYAGKKRAGVSELADEPDSNPGAVRRAGASPVIRTCSCGSLISRRAIQCKSCVPKPTKINWPSNEELLNMLESSNYSKLAKALGVSDNAIRKRLQRATQHMGS